MASSPAHRNDWIGRADGNARRLPHGHRTTDLRPLGNREHSAAPSTAAALLRQSQHHDHAPHCATGPGFGAKTPATAKQ